MNCYKNLIQFQNYLIKLPLVSYNFLSTLTIIKRNVGIPKNIQKILSKINLRNLYGTL